MVLEFKLSGQEVIERKLKRFNELKIKIFNDNLEPNEEIELNKIEKWLKIHNI